MAQSVNSLLGIFQGFQGNKGRQAVGCILGPVCQMAIQVQWGLSASKSFRKPKTCNSDLFGLSGCEVLTETFKYPHLKNA